MVRADAGALRDFCVAVFETLDVVPNDAAIAAEVIVAASLRGVDSHGIVWLPRYAQGLQEGLMLARPEERLVHETATTALIDAGGGLGHPVSHRAMALAMEKAQAFGSGWVTVRNSNHYGIAGYYAMMALERDMIGMAMTNCNASVLPTFGLLPMLGTNPIAVAAPAGQERPYVLDMATSVVAIGKLTLAHRAGKPIPSGWALDETGTPCTDPLRVLENRRGGQAGGVLPLGGAGELLGGHKGYGLGLLVEILSGVLPGAAICRDTYPLTPAGKPLPADLGHFFGAIRVDAYRPAEEFKATMDDLIRGIKGAPRVAGAERIYIPGEKEYEETARRSAAGISLPPDIVIDLNALAKELHIPAPA